MKATNGTFISVVLESCIVNITLVFLYSRTNVGTCWKVHHLKMISAGALAPQRQYPSTAAVNRDNSRHGMDHIIHRVF